MRKIIASQLMTLDGMFEGPNREFVPPPWSSALDEYSVEMLSKDCDTIIYGRVCFEYNRMFWENPSPQAAALPVAPLMNSTPKLVFSRTLPESPGWKAHVARDVVAEVARQKALPGKNLVMFGSGTLMDAFAKHDLIDEYVFMVNPLIMGGGTPLFRGGHARQPMKLVWARPLDTGVLLLRYARDRG